jgi:hypothetical protein
MQALYKCKQDKYPYIRKCNCNCTRDYNPLADDYPSYKYLPEAYILEPFALVAKQCK